MLFCPGLPWRIPGSFVHSFTADRRDRRARRYSNFEAKTMQDLDPDQYATLIVQQYLHEHGYSAGDIHGSTVSTTSARDSSIAKQGMLAPCCQRVSFPAAIRNPNSESVCLQPFASLKETLAKYM